MLMRVGIVTMLAFIVQKMYFLFMTWQMETTFTDSLSIIWHGVKLDAAVMSYTMFLPCVVSIVGLYTHNRWTEKILIPYFIIIATLIAIIIEADSTLYPFWKFKLDSSVFLYTDKPKEAMASVSAWFILKHLMGAMIWSTALSYTYIKALYSPKGYISNKFLHTLMHIIVTALMIILARGGLGKGTNNVSEAYFCEKQYLNHAAVNPVFNFIYSLGKTENFANEAQYFSLKECEEITNTIYNQAKDAPNDTLITTTPDILLIIWEGCNWNILTQENVCPHTIALKNTSINFSQCYANSFRTDRGQISLLSGWPAIPKTSLMKIPQKCEHMAALPKQMLDAGYQTTFWYGGDVSFANTGGYMHQAGFQRIVSDKNFDKKDIATAWGVYDGTVFNKFLEDYLQRDNSRFFDCIMTLSSHEPWEVPTKKLNHKRLNAFHYVDNCIGELVAKLSQSPKWNNLLIILTSDHGIDLNENMGLAEPQVTHIPMIWFGGAINKAISIDKIMNQTDLPATLLAQLGRGHDMFPFSRDVMSRSYNYPSAIHVYNGGVSFVDSTGYTTYDIDGNIAVWNADTLREKKAKACLQILYRKTAEL